MDYTERRISGEMKYEGVVVNVRLDQIELYNGRRSRREIIEHPGGVCIVPIDEEGNVTVVRQYRYAFSEHMLELPAGKLEPGEQPESCALRELSEETGLIPGRFTYLGEIRTSPGITTETLHLYLAENCTQGRPHLDPGEFLDVLRMPLKQLLDMITSGEIKDGKTIIGLLRADSLRRR